MSSPMITLPELLAEYAVDIPHAACVEGHAARLFDATRALHGLGARDKSLLKSGSLLHNVGLNVDEARHHTVGRDIVHGARLKGFTTKERDMLACMVAFHRKTPQPALEPLFERMDGATQKRVLALSALLRIADGLDESQSQSTVIESAQVDPQTRRLSLQCAGPYSHSDAARAMRKADLWRNLFGDVHAQGRLATPGLTHGMPLAEAALRMLRFHFDQTPAAHWRLDEQILTLDSQAFKAIRLAVRCMRQDFQRFEPWLKRKATRGVIKGLKPLSEVLGPARDCDVLVDAVVQAMQTADADAQAALTVLRDVWEARRMDARRAVVAYGATPAHTRWLAEVNALFSQREADAYARKLDVGQPSRVRHVFKSMFWQAVAVVRAFDTLPGQPHPETVHEIRKAVKRVRYYMEGMRGVFSDKAINRWVERCSAVQAAFGAINDAHMIARETRLFLDVRADLSASERSALTRFAETKENAVRDAIPNWRATLESMLGKGAAEDD